MRDENHLNELLERLNTVRVILRAKCRHEGAGVVDEAMTQLRVLFDEAGDLRIRICELETEIDALRDDVYYEQDRRDEERERADELQLRLDEARAIEAGLRADLAGMSEHHWTKGHE